MKSWHQALQLCVVAIVVTACMIAFMMATASNPSADDFWKALGTGGMGVAAYLWGRRNA